MPRSARVSAVPSAAASIPGNLGAARLPSNPLCIRPPRARVRAAPAAFHGRLFVPRPSRELRHHRPHTTPPQHAWTPRRRAPRTGRRSVEGSGGAARRRGTSGCCRRSRGRERFPAAGRNTKAHRDPGPARRARAPERSTGAGGRSSGGRLAQVTRVAESCSAAPLTDSPRQHRSTHFESAVSAVQSSFS